MEKSSRITIMEGEVVTFARGFSSRPGAFGGLHEAQAPFGSDESVELFIEAVRAAQAEARSLAHKDRGNYRRAVSAGESKG